jgi:hypothetical protein
MTSAAKGQRCLSYAALASILLEFRERLYDKAVFRPLAFVVL